MLIAAIWRRRAPGTPAPSATTRFPGPVDAPFLEAVGLRPQAVDLLWGSWCPWGAPQLPAWLREAWPSPIC
eukprot:1811886-Alexandrium_andersonii.AAC.1